MAQRTSSIRDKIQAYYGDMAGEHDRYRSWEHCYRYFQHASPESIKSDRNHAALQLGFYLASWGMYRGSSFLLQYAYTAHLGVIDELVAPQCSCLWQHEFGPTENGIKLLPAVVETINANSRGIPALRPGVRGASGVGYARFKDTPRDGGLSPGL